MTPKSMLRDKRTASHLDEMGPGTTFHRVLWDDAGGGTPYSKKTLVNDNKIRRVIMCSGKVYFDLYKAREERGLDDVYILRLEQLYPFPVEALTEELKRFSKAEMMWAQEEPRNMGAWSFAEPNIETVLLDIGAKHTRPVYVGRPAMAATATGLMSKHLKQLEAFLADAFVD